MLKRIKAPLMELWNGIGGKIEEGESPDAAAIREVLEESDICVQNYYSKATITWETSSSELDGLHVYLFELDRQINDQTPKMIREGILDWKSIDWILDPNNPWGPRKSPSIPSNLIEKKREITSYIIKMVT